MKILAITQARYGSSRLPAKILKKVGDKTLLQIHLERILQSKKISKLIVATTDEDGSQAIVDIAKSLGVASYKGSVDDVLSRFYHAASPEKPDIVIRLTSDCPLIDPWVIDAVVEDFIKSGCDYESNAMIPSYPDGIDTEVFKFSALEYAFENATLKSDREHVTPYIKRHSDIDGGNIFKAKNYSFEKDWSSERITVDTQEDFNLISHLIETLGTDLPFEKYINYLKSNPEIRKINDMYKRNEGYLKSVKGDNVDVIQGTGQKLYEEAKKIIPGGTQLLSKRPEQFLPNQWPAYYNKAKGCEVWDMDGNKYIDMSYMGIGACTIGYADDDINEAVKEAVDNGNMSTLNAPVEVELANLLLELHPWAEMVRYARSGGEAMAMAVRIARASTQKDIILFSGYHGWHDWYLSANLSNDKALDGTLLPGLSPVGVARGMEGTAYPFSYESKEQFLELIQKYEDKIGGIVMEAVRNFNPDPHFFATVEREAKRLNIPIIVDEVSSGFRLNPGGAHLVIGLNPDIAVFAKGLSNGFPMAAIIGNKKYMDAAQDTFISSTYWTETIGPTAALATIKKMLKCNVQEHLVECGKKIQKGWAELAKKHGLDIHVGSMYPMSHFSFNENALVLKTLFTQEMLKKGFLATTAFYSSFAHKDAHLELYLESVDEVFKFIAKVIKEGDPENYLNGPVCQSGFKRLS